MNDIKQFLITHPLISIRAIEQLIGIPLGTIRIKTDRLIPDKYTQSITDILKDYGFNSIALCDNIIEQPIAKCESVGTVYEIGVKTIIHTFDKCIGNIRILKQIESLPIGTKYNIHVIQ